MASCIPFIVTALSFEAAQGNVLCSHALQAEAHHEAADMLKEWGAASAQLQAA